MTEHRYEWIVNQAETAAILRVDRGTRLAGRVRVRETGLGDVFSWETSVDGHELGMHDNGRDLAEATHAAARSVAADLNHHLENVYVAAAKAEWVDVESSSTLTATSQEDGTTHVLAKCEKPGGEFAWVWKAWAIFRSSMSVGGGAHDRAQAKRLAEEAIFGITDGVGHRAEPEEGPVDLKLLEETREALAWVPDAPEPPRPEIRFEELRRDPSDATQGENCQCAEQVVKGMVVSRVPGFPAMVRPTAKGEVAFGIAEHDADAYDMVTVRISGKVQQAGTPSPYVYHHSAAVMPKDAAPALHSLSSEHAAKRQEILDALTKLQASGQLGPRDEARARLEEFVDFIAKGRSASPSVQQVEFKTVTDERVQVDIDCFNAVFADEMALRDPHVGALVKTRASTVERPRGSWEEFERRCEEIVRLNRLDEKKREFANYFAAGKVRVGDREYDAENIVFSRLFHGDWLEAEEEEEP